MSLVIDSNVEYLQTALHISAVKFQEEYANMSVEEIIEAEAAAGNQLAIELAQELTSNVNLVMELFDLADTNNKFMILQEMTALQLRQFLPQMEEKDLLQGLYFFTDDKLMKMLEELPPEQLVNTVFENGSGEPAVIVIIGFKTESPQLIGIAFFAKLALNGGGNFHYFAIVAIINQSNAFVGKMLFDRFDIAENNDFGGFFKT